MSREHAKAFSDIEGVTLLGVAGRSHDRASAFAGDFGISVVAHTVDDLYKKTQADLVIIAVTDDQSTEVALAALKHPWAILMEKPPGLDCQETNQLRKVASERDHPVYVGLNRRFISSTQEVQLTLTTTQGSRHIVVQDQQDLAVAASFGYSQRILDHWMFANSIHLIDYITAFARGEISEIRILQPWNLSNPGIVSAFLKYDSGDTAIYEALWNRPGPWAVSVTTAQNRFELRPLEHVKQQNRGSREWISFDTHPWDSMFKPGFRRQADEVIKGLRCGQSEAVTLEQSWESMRLVESIYFPNVTCNS